jgi:hypothetical protein
MKDMQYVEIPNTEEMRLLMEIKENIERSIEVVTGVNSVQLGAEDREALIDYMAVQNYELMRDFVENFGIKKQENFF